MSKIPGFGFSNRTKLKQPAIIKRGSAVAPQPTNVNEKSHNANAVKEDHPDNNHNIQHHTINDQLDGHTSTTLNGVNNLKNPTAVQGKSTFSKGSLLTRPNTRIAPASSNTQSHGAAPYTRLANTVAPAPIHNIGKNRGTGNVHVAEGRQSLPQPRSRLAGPQNSATHVLASAKTRKTSAAFNEKAITRGGIVAPRYAWTDDALVVPVGNTERRDARPASSNSRPSSSMLPPRHYSKPNQKLNKKTSQSLQNLPSGRPRSGMYSAKSLSGSKESLTSESSITPGKSKTERSLVGLQAPRTRSSRLDKRMFGKGGAARRVAPQVEPISHASTPAKTFERANVSSRKSPIIGWDSHANELSSPVDRLTSPVDELSPISVELNEKPIIKPCELNKTTVISDSTVNDKNYPSQLLLNSSVEELTSSVDELSIVSVELNEKSIEKPNELNKTTVISDLKENWQNKPSQTFVVSSDDETENPSNALDKTQTFTNSFDVVSEQNTTDQKLDSSCELLWNITMPEFNDVSSLNGPSSADHVKAISPQKKLISDDLSYDIVTNNINTNSKSISVLNHSRIDDDILPDMRGHASSISTSTPARFLKKDRPLTRRNTVLGVMNRESPSEMSRASNTSFRPPRQLTIFETDQVGNVEMDYETYHHIYNDVRNIKTLLLKLKRELQESEVHSPLSKQLTLPFNISMKKIPLCATLSTPPISPSRPGMRPKSFSDADNWVLEANPSRPIEHHNETGISTVNKTRNATDDEKRSTDTVNGDAGKTAEELQQEQCQLQRNVEELNHELQGKDFTIKLLQTQLEKNNFCEEMESLQEENILLREEMQQLQDKYDTLSTKNSQSDCFNGDSRLPNGHMKLTKSDIGTMRKMYADGKDDSSDI